MTSQIKIRFVAKEFPAPHFGWSERLCCLIHLCIKPFELLLDLPIASGHELLVVAVGGQRLFQCEEVLGSIVSRQRGHDRFLGRLYSPIAQFGQELRIPLSRQNGIDDRQAAQAGNIAKNVVECTFIWSNAFCICRIWVDAN